MDWGLRVAAHHQNRGMCLGEGAVLVVFGCGGHTGGAYSVGVPKTMDGHGDDFGPGLTKPKKALPANVFAALFVCSWGAPGGWGGGGGVVTMEGRMRTPTVSSLSQDKDCCRCSFDFSSGVVFWHDLSMESPRPCQ